MRDADEHTLLASLPANRVADLAARSAAGHLTALEALALCVLRGGREGEEAAPALIDAALAEYGHGAYRVPVRVVADWARCLFVATCPPGMDGAVAVGVIEDLRKKLLIHGGCTLCLEAGSKLEVYECAAPPAEPVVVRPASLTESAT